VSGPIADARRPRSSFRKTAIAAVAAASCLAVAGTMLGSSAAAADTVKSSARGDTVQRNLDALVRADRFPGALAAVRGRDGQVRNYTAGVGDLTTTAKVPVDGQVRVGSNTKTFVATVVLQLVGEGKIDLAEPIEHYLPSLVRGDGIDGRKITVRQLLQHTSGLPDYDGDVTQDYLTKMRHTYFDPRDLLDFGLSHPALFAPGTSWEYSNTNYVVAALLVQKVTGRPIGEEITKRVINRIGLRHTYWPQVGDQSIRGAHPQGYFAAKPGDPLVDVTESDPSAGWAAGAMISTPGDILTFFTALIDGRLLAPAQLRQMETTVAAPGSDVRGDERYGLGLETFSLSCGGFAWSHGGDYPGYETRNAVTSDGRGAVVAVTALPTTLDAATHVEDAVDAAICG
jgi:D-alanyl-D-alanine carboxypeptidase